MRDFFASYDLMKPSRINDLKMDSQGRHWILTEEGALRYDPATDKVSIVSNLSSYEFVETNDTYFIGSRNGIILYIRKGDREVKTHQLDTRSSIKLLRQHPSGGLVASISFSKNHQACFLIACMH